MSAEAVSSGSDRVTRSEAASALGVNKSTVSRWCAKHPALLDADGLVSVEELRRHRSEVIDPSLQTRTSGKDPAPKSTPSDQADAGSGSFTQNKARTEAARAHTAELELAERLKETLRRRDVEMSVAEAGETIRQKGFQLARDRAEALSRIDDVRAMEKALDDLVREMLAAGAEALADLADHAEAADAA